ncbi:MAG: phospho-N-acetylmuramoyl-pentapeptide-transferase [Ruminococcus sp.]|jgi:phospho-N-acetylmuramoyl-pentapeptide-transferase|nr:phospho-N-acetylmuramoyl-pentapeptide-transferase [Ruminococcus sp.]MBS4926201.1 phospho-N-acetylmuramoyl-pentapeptide-transferase [Ruminococcus bicirculans (ex Wegman et al. 2014)]RGG74088.1 phospho-N-acetylmuramoyl-pentapeptide-transferase [Ruminococcus sp. AF17-6LB]RGG75757.1 phospho-N-acetylmuramoyl-pentapeptide-transferase [Ruminococcus sp. AF17-6]RGG76099.1 phospho-N-acetylmuramoyl-pentapeptide-transferase [Ruminococcus sp. AF17-24]RGG82601.1 phospho-N-acetylmuramoyl-pentapeptide-tran
MTMFYNLLAKTNNTTLVLLVPMLCSFLIAFFSLKFFKRILPKDQGRAFAVNGALSEGKPRGAGIIFVTSFTLCTALFYPLDIENIIYLVLVYAAMLSGYFDDAAETPWGNLKKGLIDLVISLGIAFTYYFYNGSQVKLYITDSTFTIPAPLFIILAGVLVWTAINVTNCTDGVDGLCGSLVMTVLLPLAFMVTKSGAADMLLPMIMFVTLAAYLWFNCSPSQMLMGDAGSRALGVFLAVMFLKTAAPFAFIPMAIVIILDGGLGLLKLSFRRFLKIKNFMEGIRTPLHDHARKNKGWSDTQVVIRFTILQIIVNLCFMAFVL